MSDLLQDEVYMLAFEISGGRLDLFAESTKQFVEISTQGSNTTSAARREVGQREENQRRANAA